MHRNTKIYTAISIILGITLCYEIFRYAIVLRENDVSFYLSWKNLFPTLVGIAGVLSFVLTKFKNTRLIKVYMCYVIFLVPFSLLGIQRALALAAREEKNLFMNWRFDLFLLTIIMVISASCIGLWKISRAHKPLLQQLSIGDESFSEFRPAPAGLRFINRLLDVSIIFYIIYSQIFDNYFFRRQFAGTGSGAFFLVEVILTFYFYLVLEGIFNTSIGKAITNTMVVNEFAERASFGQVIGRTFCRYIPFDALSFFRKNPRGWHDSISGTYVVEIQSEEAANELSVKDEEVIIA